MRQLILVIIAVLCVNVCHAQSRNTDPLYASDHLKTTDPVRLSRQEWRIQKKQIKEIYKKENPLIINHGVLVAGVSMIGTGVGLIGISNGLISKKKEDLELRDTDKLAKLNKQQRIFNYVGGGISIIGAILCLSSSHREGYWGAGYSISKRLSVKDKNRSLALVYRF